MSVCWVLPSYRSTLTTCTICTCTTTCTNTKCWVLPGAPSLLFGQYQVLVCSSKTMSCRCSSLPDAVSVSVYNTCAWNLKFFVCKAFHGSETSLFQQEQVSLWWTRWRIWELQNPRVRFKTQNLQYFIIAWVCSVQCDPRYRGVYLFRKPNFQLSHILA